MTRKQTVNDTVQMAFRCSEDERAAIKMEAARLKMPIQEYCLKVILEQLPKQRKN
jgi:hypothetical protein